MISLAFLCYVSIPFKLFSNIRDHKENTSHLMLDSCLLNFQDPALIPLDRFEAVKTLGGALISPNIHFSQVRKNASSDIFAYWRASSIKKVTFFFPKWELFTCILDDWETIQAEKQTKSWLKSERCPRPTHTLLIINQRCICTEMHVYMQQNTDFLISRWIISIIVWMTYCRYFILLNPSNNLMKLALWFIQIINLQIIGIKWMFHSHRPNISHTSCVWLQNPWPHQLWKPLLCLNPSLL